MAEQKEQKAKDEKTTETKPKPEELPQVSTASHYS